MQYYKKRRSYKLLVPNGIDRKKAKRSWIKRKGSHKTKFDALDVELAKHFAGFLEIWFIYAVCMGEFLFRTILFNLTQQYLQSLYTKKEACRSFNRQIKFTEFSIERVKFLHTTSHDHLHDHFQCHYSTFGRFIVTKQIWKLTVKNKRSFQLRDHLRGKTLLKWFERKYICDNLEIIYAARIYWNDLKENTSVIISIYGNKSVENNIHNRLFTDQMKVTCENIQQNDLV